MSGKFIATTLLTPWLVTAIYLHNAKLFVKHKHKLKESENERTDKAARGFLYELYGCVILSLTYKSLSTLKYREHFSITNHLREWRR